MNKHAQIHRFGDTVAVFLADGETVYLTPADSRRIAKALNACARDIANSRFVESPFKTAEFTLADTGHNGTSFKTKRSR